ncbi:OsmC family protein [Solitalea canadensis]|uniref:Putative redox protein, regulator of disulfide bond formation n=1 Tax=Solitalea canadensis (strain ATCC 29591 / DSM 3403 / JCM 21819 / LMG 8368 / NBRC 15130 / NCIMB 12057 / USAM 9D) TaxID=929556 RepID=H8KXJ4_SOLCM|nr:OsmC family protein [Solitalea canadensis]AFD05290.1 putative redox protein, regulator of disulfide bond formation [Solitalea canadensis DSM 3403]
MSKEQYYEVNLQWNDGRTGSLSSPVLNETITCATPPEFPNGVPGIWSPEHLYAATINSCYMSTFLAVAENFKLPFSDFSCKTVCKLEVVEGKYLITEAVIAPTVTLQDHEADKDKALKVLEKSKSACLVTNSIKTAISLNISLS